MSHEADILPNWFSYKGIILAKGELNHLYTIWTMLMRIFSQFANFGNQSLSMYVLLIAKIKEVEGGKKKSRQAQNLANSKKSTILLQSLWNLVKMIISRVDLVARISAWSD